MQDKIIINDEFVRIAHLGRKPEKRFRFAGNCETNNCKQWSEGRCGVIDKVIEILKSTERPSKLPECSIKSDCRWYRQCGAKACAVCPEVITDLSDEQ